MERLTESKQLVLPKPNSAMTLEQHVRLAEIDASLAELLPRMDAERQKMHGPLVNDYDKRTADWKNPASPNKL